MLPVLGDVAREACGVVGIYSDPARSLDVARMAFFALYALQHRGQESAGIAACDGIRAQVHRGMGLVSQVFDEESLKPLVGHLGIGHNRYSTTGSSELRNAQPYLIETLHGPLAVGHNGNLTNATTLRRELLTRGVGLSSTTDSEVITQFLAAPPPGQPVGPAAWEDRIKALMGRAEGAYSLVVMTREAVYAVRDPLGLRPLCLGELVDADGTVVGWCAASETAALPTIGARFLREVEPGEVVRLDAQGVHSVYRAPVARHALCVFEYVYFARPDSDLEGQSIHDVRQRMGERLAREAPVEADVVIAAPDSATPSAIGFAQVAGIPFTEGLMKNRYIGRTFIQPSDRLRQAGVRLKYNPLVENLRGRRVVLVDDSIVRGNTMGPLVRLLRDAGATEVHVRVASPPIQHPCYMGVDLATYGELIAHRLSVEEIRVHVGADSLAYLTLPGMMDSINAQLEERPQGRHCKACFNGRYPLSVEAVQSNKTPFETADEIQGVR